MDLFQVLDQVGTVAYRLSLPEEARIHPVFHCSLLKPFKGPLPLEETTQLPPDFINAQSIITPLAILDQRQTSTTGDSWWEVFVQWQGISPDETSWEDWSTLCTDYHLEDKVVLQGRWVIAKHKA